MRAEDELQIHKQLDAEREKSNKIYAPMIVKTIVFGFVGLICIAFVSWLTSLIW